MEATKYLFSTVVLGVGMHCEACASEIKVYARGLEGVKKVKVDIDSNQLTVLGEVDPLQIQEELRRKFKKKVDMVSSYPKKGDNGTTSDKNKDDKKSNEEKPDIDKKQPKEALETTIVVVLKLGHYCQGCSSKIRNIVWDTNGVQEMVPDEEKEMITVKGNMDAKVLLENLKERLNGPVEILSVNKEKYSNGSDKESENGNDDKKRKKESAQENRSDDTEMERSIMELKPVKVPAIMAVFKVPLHCDGCIRRIRKIISRIRGVQKVTINKEEETVTVKATTDVNTLTETMKKRLKKLVEERKIEIQKGAEVVKDTSLCSFKTQDHKQESIPSAPLQFSEQQPDIIQIISVQEDQDQSLVISADAHAKIDSEIGDSSPTIETAEWAFLLTSLFLEGVSALLDQLGYLLVGMALSFVALLLSTIDLVNSARREGLIKMERLSCSLCFRSELFTVVQCFGFTSAVWQCIYSTMQYIYALRNLDNPIKMTLLPFIFLLCVLISKLVRKMEEINCQDIEMPRIKPQSDLNHSEDALATAMEFKSGHFGCSHYRRRCKIRAPCCNEDFYCVHCHNEAKNSGETSPDDQHYIPSHEVIKVICSLCEEEQDVKQNCVSCGVCMGKYFCAKCIFFDDDVLKNQYHCDECGICRDGGRENFFHCKKCGKWLESEKQTFSFCLMNTVNHFSRTL
ncbi:uncharacterized protein LOC110673322 isoform X1 [Hevea brasiliensis]|uniref:uncharacterized protein LOC110673322 isoform X1 n=1 Tax=Hevea brasiliensis TaxID=3981 RepID=UPI0025D48962|nr:uncharacterized protein LOC110673322 isoform X1 [Hevea brasiliensis]